MNLNSLAIKEFFITKIFFHHKKFGQEMLKFQELMKENPNHGKQLLSQGHELIQFAGNGNYFRFSIFLADLISHFDESPTSMTSTASFPFMYFLHKSLEISLQSLHFMISSFIIDNGYPLNGYEMPNLLILCLKNPELNDDSCHEIIHFLQLKGFDINLQVRNEFLPIFPFHRFSFSGRQDFLFSFTLCGREGILSLRRTIALKQRSGCE